MYFPHRPSRLRRRGFAALALAAALCLTLSGCNDDRPNLAATAENVFSDASVWRGDDRYLTVTITDGTILSTLDLEVYLETLDFSPAVYERMNRTRALDGTQAATSPSANVTWTYHPDSGLQVVFEREDGQ